MKNLCMRINLILIIVVCLSLLFSGMAFATQDFIFAGGLGGKSYPDIERALGISAAIIVVVVLVLWWMDQKEKENSLLVWINSGNTNMNILLYGGEIVVKNESRVYSGPKIDSKQLGLVPLGFKSLINNGALGFGDSKQLWFQIRVPKSILKGGTNAN